MRIDAAGKIPFQLVDYGTGLVEIVSDDHQRRVSKRFGLEFVGTAEELFAVDFE